MPVNRSGATVADRSTDDGPVLVLGASGNVGSALTAILAGRGVPTRALYAPSTPPRPRFAEEVVTFEGSFGDENLVREAMRGVRSVFMLTPPSPSQPEWHRTIVGAAVEAGVGRIVKLSAFDSGPDSSLQMGRWHAHGEREVQNSGIPNVILRPQYFMQMELKALAEATRTGVYRGASAGSLRMGFVDARDIAAVAAAALTSADYDGRVLIPTGPAAVSFDEIAAALASAEGRDVVYEQRPEHDVRRSFENLGWPEWHIEDYLKIHGEASSELVTTDVFDVTGVIPRSIDDLIAENLSAWQQAKRLATPTGG